MANKLYVGNLSYQTSTDNLRNAFANYGEVVSCTIVVDRYTNQSKGFAFVEFADAEAAQAAIGGMNGQNLDGRQIKVNEANDKPRTDRGNGGGGYRNDRW